MRRWSVVLVACGGSTVVPPTNTAPVRPPVQPVIETGPEDCAARVEDWPPGNHDRYSFEDPLTQKRGFKDGKGNIVIAATFHHVYEFGPGGVSAAIDVVTPFVFIDVNGKRIAKAYASDNGPDYFQEGIARIVDDKKKVGFMTDRGEILSAPRYDDAGSFCHGKAEVQLGGETFWIDKRGNKTAPPTKQ